MRHRSAALPLAASRKAWLLGWMLQLPHFQVQADGSGAARRRLMESKLLLLAYDTHTDVDTTAKNALQVNRATALAVAPPSDHTHCLASAPNPARAPTPQLSHWLLTRSLSGCLLCAAYHDATNRRQGAASRATRANC